MCKYHQTKLIMSKKKVEIVKPNHEELVKELNDLKIKHEELLSMKARINAGHQKFYNKKFVVRDTMTEGEKEIIIQNKYHRNSLARARYIRSPEQQRKAKERATQRYIDRLSDEERIRYYKRKRARELAKSSSLDSIA